MTKEYKIETKPTFWHVILSEGCYSDYSEDSLFFRANNEDEVWDMLCRYLEDVYIAGDYSSKKAISLYESDKKYAIKKWIKYEKEKDENWNEDQIDWESDYGDAKSVAMGRLDVIEFLK